MKSTRAMGNPSPLAREFFEQGRCRTCPLVDLHGHWNHSGNLYLPAAPAERMVAALRRAGVTRIVCSSSDALLADPHEGNREMQAAVDRYPDLVSAYWSVNPNYPELAARAPKGWSASRGFVGFKLLPDYHVYPVTGDRYRPALEFANEHGLLVLVHTWGGSAFDSPQLLEEVAVRYPRAVFLMGHSGYGDWDTSLRVARERPNVYLELTAVYAAHDFPMMPSGSGTPSALMSCLQVNGIIERMVAEAGSRKIVFGTDMPWYSPHYAAGAVLFARITDEARHDILHRNGERLLAGVPAPEA